MYKLASHPNYMPRSFQLALPLACLSGMATIAHFVSSGEFSVPILFILCGGLGLILAKIFGGTSFENSTFVTRLFILGYSINVLVVFALYYYYLADHGSPFHATPLQPYDDEHFHRIGTTLAKDWTQGTTRSAVLIKEYTYKGYPWILGGIYYFANILGDMSVIAPRLINALCGGFLAVVVFALAEKTYDSAVARRASTLFVYFPTLWYFSANTLRDIVIALFIGISALLVLKLQGRQTSAKRLGTLFIFAMCLMTIFLLRSSTFFALLAALGLYSSLYLHGAISRILVVGLCLSLLAVALLHGQDFGAPPPESLLRQSGAWNQSIVSGASRDSLALKYIYGAPSYMFLPLNALYTAVVPIPPIKSMYLPDIIEGLGAIFWYFLLPFWAIGIYGGIRNRHSMLLIFTSLTLFAGVVHIAASSRHKTQFLALAFVHIGEATVRHNNRVPLICSAVALVFSVLAGVYLMIKF